LHFGYELLFDRVDGALSGVVFLPSVGLLRRKPALPRGYNRVMKATILGSGTSHGVPMIGCECTVCTSPDPKNRRFRPSIAVENDGNVILVDTTPELRMQSLAFGLNRVDAVLITHTHADHIFGLDDLRRFNDLSGESIPVYGDEQAVADIRRLFPYIFDPPKQGGGTPKIDLRPVPESMEMFGMHIESFPVLHGSLPVLAYRFDNVAYVTDTNHIPPESMTKLRGLELLILDAVRYEPHSTHFGLWEAVAVAEQLGAKRVLFTHLSHHFEHTKTNSELPAHMQLAYDGQTLEY
jgi:phosphoribosyl 1,2-cyclic phosphate phosphodiesterase